MTFEEALKRLAEKEPEKFCYQREEKASNGELVQLERFWLSHKRWHLLIGKEPVTQDFIDAILAEIGWAYEVGCVAGEWPAKWYYSIVAEDEIGGEVGHEYPTKLGAAKAALVAVVEREYPL